MRSCVSRWIARRNERRSIPCGFRPWLQAFADYAFDRRQFGEKEMEAQISAAQSFGSDGWILWNARNVYSADIIRVASKKNGNVHPSTDAATDAALISPTGMAPAHRN